MEAFKVNRSEAEKQLGGLEEMVRWAAWVFFKHSFLFPILKLPSALKHKPKGDENGLVCLYKDMESCGEYPDIQVMWQMIQSCQPIAPNTQTGGGGGSSASHKLPSMWRFCLWPN